MTLLLNAAQSREYNRSRTLVKYVVENQDTCALLPPFSKIKDALLSNNNRLDKYTPVKTANGIGITVEKRDLKAEVAAQVNNICTLTTSYAMTIGDKDLQNAVRYRTSTVTHMKDGEILGLVNGLAGIIQPLLDKDNFKEYPITAGTLKQLTNDATNFDNTIGKASIIDTNSSIAGKNIDAILKDIRGNVVQFNLLIDWFKKDHPDFVKGYHHAAAIDYSGVHRSGIRGIVRNSVTGALIEGASLMLQGKRKTKKTTAGDDGAFEITKFLAGKAKLIITAPGYSSQTIAIKIIRGKTIELSIELQSQVIALTATA